LNEILDQPGHSYAFDTPLTPKETITLIYKYVESCPYDLEVTPFKQLWAKLPSKGDTKVKTSFKGDDAKIEMWCQFLYNDKIVVSRREQCALPATVTGYVYVVVTDTATPISLKDDSHILAGPALLFKGDY
jgi:hypothetical protein